MRDIIGWIMLPWIVGIQVGLLVAYFRGSRRSRRRDPEYTTLAMLEAYARVFIWPLYAVRWARHRFTPAPPGPTTEEE